MSLDAFYQLKLFDYIEPSLIKTGLISPAIIFGYTDGVRPEGSYCVINITNIPDDAPVEVLYSYTDNPQKEIDEDLIYRALLTFTLDFYGPEAMSKARQMKALFYSNAMIELAQLQGFGFRDYGEIANLTEVRNGKYEYRVAFPVSLNLIYTYNELIATIGQVRVIGTEKYSGKQIIDEVITEE